MEAVNTILDEKKLMGTFRAACMHAQTRAQKQLYILLLFRLIFFYTMSIFPKSTNQQGFEGREVMFCFVQKMFTTDIPGLWVIAQIERDNMSSHKKFHYLVNDEKILFELWNFKKKCLNKCRERERENLLYSA